MVYLSYRMEDGQVIDVCHHVNTQYVMENGELLDVLQETAWCRTCNTLRSVEDIPSLDDVAANFTPADRYTLRVISNKNAISYMVADSNRLRWEWRQKRVSPAKCIRCGSTDLFVISDECSRDEVTGHEFEICNLICAEDCIPGVRIRLSPEGDLIESNEEDLFIT